MRATPAPRLPGSINLADIVSDGGQQLDRVRQIIDTHDDYTVQFDSDFHKSRRHPTGLAFRRAFNL